MDENKETIENEGIENTETQELEDKAEIKHEEGIQNVEEGEGASQAEHGEQGSGEANVQSTE